MRFFLLFFFILFSFNSIAFQIEKIVIEGNNSISRGTVLNYLSFEVGDEINEPNAEKSIQSLLKTGLFKEVTISSIDSTLIVKVSENPTIKYFEIKGYKEDEVLSGTIIENITKNLGLGVGAIYDDSKMQKAMNQLKRLYSDNGYVNTEITSSNAIDSRNRIGVEIIINENDQSTIGSFKIFGNSFFSSEELKELFDIGEPDFFLMNWFTEKDKFSKLKLSSGIEKIISKYLDNGFLEVNVTPPLIKFSQINNKISISIEISEGKRFKIRKIIFQGNYEGYKTADFFSLIKTKENDFVKRSTIVGDSKNISSLFQNDGYAYASVNGSLKPTDNNELLDLVFDINADTRIYVNRIQISGNTRTQDDVIRRELQILEGQRYSKSELSESILRIKRLGYFQNVEYTLNRHSENLDRADLNIVVNETKTGEISIGLGHSNATGSSLNFGIQQKNILGTGNTFNAALSNSEAVEETSFYFKDPYFNNLGHSVSYGLFSKTLDASNLDASSYTLDESGFIFGYGIPLSKDSNLFGEFRPSEIDLSCGTDLLSYEPSDCADSKNKIDAKVTFTYKKNTLNDALMPSEGSLLRFTSNIGTPVGDYKYYQLEGFQKSYFPLNEDWIFKINNRLNYGSGYANDHLPLFKRYFEGGSSSVRGFDFNSLGAKYANGKPKGGELTFLSSLGLSRDMSPVGVENKNIRFIGFVDAGAISEKISDFEFDDIRVSSGFGIDWLTPIGPIGVHYAIPVLKKSGDNTKTFSFDLGASF